MGSIDSRPATGRPRVLAAGATLAAVLVCLAAAASSSTASAQGPMPTMPPGQLVPPPPGGQLGVPTYPGPLAARLGHRKSLFGSTPCPSPVGGDVCPPSYERLEPASFGDPNRRRYLREATGLFANATLTFDYLHYDFDDPGDILIGAQQATQDARDPFLLTAVNNQIGQAFDTSSFSLTDVPGVRGLLTVDSQYGEWTAGVWGFQQSDSSLFEDDSLDTLPGFLGVAPVLPVVTLLDGGEPSNSAAIVFNDLRVDLKNELMGAKIDYALRALTPENSLFRVRPVLGFQYLRFRESFRIGGSFDPEPTIDDMGVPVDDDPFLRTIAARTDNHLFAPTFALRFEAGNDWFSLMAEPKLAMAANRRRNKLSTRNLESTPDVMLTPTVASEDSDLEPYFELTLTARVRLTQRLSGHVGYNLLAFDGIGRPHRGLNYNMLGADGVAVTQTDETVQMFLSGLFVGGEVLLGPMPR